MATRRIGSLPAACVVGVLLVGDPHLGSSGIGHGAALAADGATLRDGTLTVEGTSGPDLIVLQASSHPRAVRVVLNGKQLGRFEPVHGVVVRAGEGNDIVRLDPQLGLPAKLDGGPGDDRLRGGPGPELFYGPTGTT